jgi:putative membrane fusion protein
MLILILIIISISYSLVNNNPKLAIVKYGHVVDSLNTKALLIRDENVIKAPITGTFFPLINEGDRLSYGQPVVKLKNEDKGNIILYNQMSGIISFATDGLESKLTPSSFNNIDIKKFDKLKRDYKYHLEQEYISKSSNVYRVINNFNMYLAIKVKRTEAERYQSNETVFVSDLEIENKEMIEAKIIKIINQEQDSLIIFQLRRFVSRWANIRRVNIEFIKNIHRGRIVPSDAIISTAEGKKVLVSLSVDNYKLKKIDVIFSDDQEAVVEGIEVGTNVVINPAKYR